MRGRTERVFGIGNASTLGAGGVVDTSPRLLNTNTTTENVQRPRLASNGAEWLLAFEGAQNGSGRTGARRLAADLSSLGGVTGTLGGYHAAVTWNGQNYWVVSQMSTAVDVYDIISTRVSSQGALLDTPAQVVSAAAGSEQEPAIAGVVRLASRLRQAGARARGLLAMAGDVVHAR